MPMIDPAVLAEIKALEAAKDYHNPRYMELLMQHHYVHHVLRVPLDAWPDSVERTFKHLNPKVYIPMQGPSELGASGKLASWDRTADLGRIARGADDDHRRAPRHDGSGAHGEHGERRAGRAIPRLSGWQPHGDVRRSAAIFRRLDRISPRHRLPALTARAPVSRLRCAGTTKPCQALSNSTTSRN